MALAPPVLQLLHLSIYNDLLFNMTTSTSSLNKKSLTNLYDEPQMRVTLFEPIAPRTYDLGSNEFKWGDVYVNRIAQGDFPMLTILPFGLYSTTTDAPATRTLNSNYEFYLRRVSSTSIRVFQYGNSPTAPPIEIFPPLGSMYMGVDTGNLSAGILFWLNPSGNWTRFNIGVI